MRVAQQIDDIEVYGKSRGSKDFTFKASAKQVDILVSRVYKDKVSAIIRELCCNAYDAHVVVGKQDQKFKVQLPTILDARFIVRDYGPGLSQEQIEEVYTQFFNSTKDDSNEYIGALGLGCKSPFSLVDTYTVTSYQHGTMMCYTMLKKDGMLSFRCETEDPVPTKEPDGLEVSVPIASEFFNEFKRKAAPILHWFNPKPEVPDLEEAFTSFKESFIETIDTPEGKVHLYQPFSSYGRDHNLFGSHGTYYVRMGQVVYPVDSSSVWQDRAGYISVIDVSIGAVDVQAGREELSYDEETKAFLEKRIPQVKQQVINHYSQGITAAPNIREAYMQLTKSTVVKLGHDVKYKGFALNGGNFVWPSGKFEVKVESIASKYRIAKTRSEDYHHGGIAPDDDLEDYFAPKDDKDTAEPAASFVIRGDQLIAVSKSENGCYNHYQNDQIVRDLTAKVLATLKVIYVLVDDTSGAAKKLTTLRKKLRRQYADSDKLVVLATMRASSTLDGIMLTSKALSEVEATSVKAALDPSDEVYLMSELKRIDDMPDVYTFSGRLSKGYCNRRNWKVANINSDGGVYWPIVNNTLKHCAGKHDERHHYEGNRVDKTLNKIFDYAVTHFKKEHGNNFLLVPERRVEDLGDGWHSLPDLMAGALSEKLKDLTWARGFVTYYTDRERATHYMQRNINKLIERLAPDHPIRWLQTQGEYEEKHKEEYRFFVDAMWLLDHKSFTTKAFEKRQQKWQTRGLNRYNRTKSKRSENLSRIAQIASDYKLVFNHYYGDEHEDDFVLFANHKHEIMKQNGGKMPVVSVKRKAKAKAKAKKDK